MHPRHLICLVLAISPCAGREGGSQPTPPAPAPEITLTDIDGNRYQARKLGSRYWMTSNFRATRDPGGKPLQGVFAYRDDPGIARTHGRLYAWPAALQAAPAGWRLPTAEEWQELITLHGGASVAGGRMKAAGTAHWEAPNAGAADTLGFAAVGGGFRAGDGVFWDLGRHGSYWGSTQNGREPYSVYMFHTHPRITTYASPEDKTSGIAFAIRYVKE